jgi:hypothetical protein
MNCAIWNWIQLNSLYLMSTTGSSLTSCPFPMKVVDPLSILWFPSLWCSGNCIKMDPNLRQIIWWHFQRVRLSSHCLSHIPFLQIGIISGGQGDRIVQTVVTLLGASGQTALL